MILSYVVNTFWFEIKDISCYVVQVMRLLSIVLAYYLAFHKLSPWFQSIYIKLWPWNLALSMVSRKFKRLRVEVRLPTIRNIHVMILLPALTNQATNWRVSGNRQTSIHIYLWCETDVANHKNFFCGPCPEG